MKKYILLFFTAVFPFFLCGFTYENEFVDEQVSLFKNEIDIGVLSEETAEILDILGLDEIDAEKIMNLSFDDLTDFLIESITSKIKEPFKSIFYIASAAIVCSIISNFCGEFLKTEKIINTVAALSSAGIILIPIKEIIFDAGKVIEECSDFMLGFIPVYSSLVTASGYVSSALGYRTLMLSAVTIISRISSEIILPLISIYFAMCIAGTVSDMNIGEISKHFKNFSVWVLGIIMTVFSGILGIGNLISASADNAFHKTTRLLIGTAVPIVGSTVSDALNTLKGCIDVTKNVFGVYGIIVTSAIFLPPIISLFLWKICLSAASAICGIIENKNLYNLISSASSVLGIMLALLVTSSVMFIFSVAILLMTGGAS